jgi:hypothetical protein
MTSTSVALIEKTVDDAGHARGAEVGAAGHQAATGAVRLAIQAAMSLSRQPTVLALIAIAAGNRPAFVSRQMVVRDRPVQAFTSGQRRIRSFIVSLHVKGDTHLLRSVTPLFRHLVVTYVGPSDF